MITAVVIVLILVALLGVGTFVFSLMPDIPIAAGVFIGDAFREIVGYGLCFLPKHCWITFIATISTFLVINLTWSVIIFITKKIPGIN